MAPETKGQQAQAKAKSKQTTQNGAVQICKPMPPQPATRWPRYTCVTRNKRAKQPEPGQPADTRRKIAPDMGSGGIFAPDKQSEATQEVAASYAVSQTGEQAVGGHLSSSRVRRDQSKSRQSDQQTDQKPPLPLSTAKSRRRARFPPIGTAPNSPPLLLQGAGPIPRHHPGAIRPTRHQSTQTDQNWRVPCPAFPPNTPRPVPA